MFHTTSQSLISANALRCYECSPTDSCKDPFNNNGVSTTSCYTSCSKTKGESSGQQVITRGCGSGSDNKCDETTVLGVKVKICQCDTDLCNGVIPVRGSFIALAASVFVFLIFL
ncbi:hypothetical protein CHS0354_027195 [Potamilus streckersoni]|uniref:Protein sleepless n=1 Tax=Potamilus streckersoni TaxID=2493646 RepID=A0AAE0SZQ3_9BIVA|nr:hypothetical protein CHS0354_027195 [Potamilus streckersoni]